MRRLLRLNPSYYAFLSGILMNPIIEIIDAASLSKPENISSFIYALIGGLLFALSGVLSLALSIKLEEIKRLSFENMPRIVDSNVAWEKIVDNESIKLYLLLFFLLVSFISGALVQSIAVGMNFPAK